jgi:hypothetical protein
LPPEHRGRVEQDDALDGGIGGGVEELPAAAPEGVERVGGGKGRRGHPLGQLLLELLEGGAKEVLLAGEVVVERAPRDAGPLDDLLP